MYHYFNENKFFLATFVDICSAFKPVLIPTLTSYLVSLDISIILWNLINPYSPIKIFFLFLF